MRAMPYAMTRTTLLRLNVNNIACPMQKLMGFCYPDQKKKAGGQEKDCKMAARRKQDKTKQDKNKHPLMYTKLLNLHLWEPQGKSTVILLITS